MKKFLINTHFIENGYSGLSKICRESYAIAKSSPIQNWLFEVSVPESNVDKFRTLINKVKDSPLVNYPTN